MCCKMRLREILEWQRAMGLDKGLGVAFRNLPFSMSLRAPSAESALVGYVVCGQMRLREILEMKRAMGLDKGVVWRSQKNFWHLARLWPRRHPCMRVCGVCGVWQEAAAGEPGRAARHGPG